MNGASKPNVIRLGHKFLNFSLVLNDGFRVLTLTSRVTGLGTLEPTTNGGCPVTKMMQLGCQKAGTRDRLFTPVVPSFESRSSVTAKGLMPPLTNYR